jgi:DNA polymerase-3 subunit delta'
MLPKIIVSGALDRQVIKDRLSIYDSSIIALEGSDTKVDTVRHWINFGVNVVNGSPEMSLVVWDADKLSPECQAVMLKPLEESRDETNMYLVVTNENGLLSTVLSRCMVVDLLGQVEDNSMYWKRIRECFVKGPAACLAYADDLDKLEMEQSLEELIKKLKLGLIKEVSKSRLGVIKLAIECLGRLRKSNVNAKLAFGDFLISSWRMVRTTSK